MSQIKKNQGDQPAGKSIAEKAKINTSILDGVDEVNTDPTGADEVNTGETDTSGADLAGTDKEPPQKPPKPTLEQELEADAENGIRLEIQITKNDLYRFLLYHSYCSVSGVLGVLLSLFCLGYSLYALEKDESLQVVAFMMFIGLWFTVLSPLLLRSKAAMQMKRFPAMQQPITYIFTEKGILQHQGEAKGACRWNQITRVVYLKKIWILYCGKVRGSILPVAQLGERKDELKGLIQRCTNPRISRDFAGK